MKLRRARPDETAWVNARYADVGFRPSDLSREVVIVAEIEGEHAGIARLVPVEGGWELGGMLVFDAYRGRGVARALIDELLRHAEGRDVYCIPFADLRQLYARAGFELVDDAPADVWEKYEWCTRTYPRAVVSMKRGKR